MGPQTVRDFIDGSGTLLFDRARFKWLSSRRRHLLSPTSDSCCLEEFVEYYNRGNRNLGLDPELRSVAAIKIRWLYLFLNLLPNES